MPSGTPNPNDTVAAASEAWNEQPIDPLSGARSPAQVDGWIDAASITLTPEDLVEIGATIQRTGAGSGPVTFRQPLTSARTGAMTRMPHRGALVPATSDAGADNACTER